MGCRRARAKRMRRARGRAAARDAREWPVGSASGVRDNWRGYGVAWARARPPGEPAGGARGFFEYEYERKSLDKILTFNPFPVQTPGEREGTNVSAGLWRGPRRSDAGSHGLYQQYIT